MVSKNNVLIREQKKPIVWDAFFTENAVKKPVVVFCHGYKGFKDWGAWDLVAEQFMDNNFFFLKFNFSHNGGTVENPIDFPDLEAFAENNYSKELDDLDAVLTFITSKDFLYRTEIDSKNISIIGHSRGGGISIIKASEDDRITKLITWASVGNFESRSSTTGDLEKWKKNGVKYVLNGRTKQQMPHNYQFYLDYKANKERLDIENAAKNITVPFLIIHAIDDPSVVYKEAQILHKLNSKSKLIAVKSSNHVFGASHPWQKKTLPLTLKIVVKKTIAFIT